MKTKKLLIFTLSLLFSVLGASAQTSDFTGAILWKISGNDLKNPSYIIGTNHIINNDFLQSIKGLAQAQMNTAQVIGEIDMDELVAKGQLLQKTAMMPDSTSYEKLLSKEEYDLLDSNLKNSLGVGIEQLKQLHPVTVSTLYTARLYNKINNQQTQPEPMDMYFQKKAKEQNKHVGGLESIEDQLEVLYNSQSIKKQVQDLLCQTSNEGYVIELMKKLDKSYKEGDLNSFVEMMNSKDNPCDMSQEMMNKLNKERNDKWLAKIPSLISERPSLIAVGCLHLVGEDGLLYQLAQKGYTVEAVK